MLWIFIILNLQTGVAWSSERFATELECVQANETVKERFEFIATSDCFDVVQLRKSKES